MRLESITRTLDSEVRCDALAAARPLCDKPTRTQVWDVHPLTFNGAWTALCGEHLAERLRIEAEAEHRHAELHGSWPAAKRARHLEAAAQIAEETP